MRPVFQLAISREELLGVELLTTAGFMAKFMDFLLEAVAGRGRIAEGLFGEDALTSFRSCRALSQKSGRQTGKEISRKPSK